MSVYNPYADIAAHAESSVQAVAVAIRRFVETVVEFHDGYVGLSVMAPGGGRPVTGWADACNGPLLTQLSIRAAVRNIRDGLGVHLNMCPRRAALASDKRGGDDDVLCVPTLWMDCDAEGMPRYNQRIAEFPTPPNIVVSSGGGGVHCYWRLLVPADPDDRTKRIMAALADHLGGDANAAHLHTMMRVPGTINTKPSRGNVVEVLDWNADRLYRLDDFAWLDPGPPVQRPAPPRIVVEHNSEAVSAAQIASQLGAKPHGSYWMARCPVPAHGKGKGDHSPSLSISQGEDGTVLLKCHAGCPTETVVAALGLRMTALFAETSRPATRAEMRALAVRRGKR